MALFFIAVCALFSLFCRIFPYLIISAGALNKSAYLIFIFKALD